MNIFDPFDIVCLEMTKKEELILETNKKQDGRLGRLPNMAPLATPYVPFQIEDPPKFDARLGLVRGTLYPGLELPFMGMINEQPLPETPSTQLQALAFAVNELALYLDTHPEDEEALQLYRQYQKTFHDAGMEFAEKYEPLTHGTPSTQNRYTWLSDPWPWEYSGNKEG